MGGGWKAKFIGKFSKKALKLLLVLVFFLVRWHCFCVVFFASRELLRSMAYFLFLLTSSGSLRSSDLKPN